MGLKEFFAIIMFYFRLYPQHSSIPFIPSNEKSIIHETV